MPWVRKFSEPIALKDGRLLESLADARGVMLSLPVSYQRTPHWQQSSDLLLKAASRDGAFALAQAQAQLPRTLRIAGLI